jgi:hypothetical protein
MRLVQTYYDETVGATLTKLVESDAQLALMTTSLLLELQPLLSPLSHQKAWGSLGLAERMPPFLHRAPRLTPQTAKRIIRMIDLLAERGGTDVEKPLSILREHIERCTNLNVFDIVEHLRGE